MGASKKFPCRPAPKRLWSMPGADQQRLSEQPVCIPRSVFLHHFQSHLERSTVNRLTSRTRSLHHGRKHMNLVGSSRCWIGSALIFFIFFLFGSLAADVASG